MRFPIASPNQRLVPKVVLLWTFLCFGFGPWSLAQSQRERSPNQAEPAWVKPAGYNLNPSTSPNASIPQSTIQSNGQRVFSALPPPNARPRTVASSEQAPSRMAQNSFPQSTENKSEVVQASYTDSPTSTNLESSASRSKAPLELRPSSIEKGGSLERPTSSWGTAVSMFLSLAVVLSFFLLVAWLVKKSQPQSFLKLPRDVVQVMGRTPMAPRQQMYVVRFGSKLLLISHQPGQTQTLGEITDADEVQRLAGLCEANHPGSISNSFRDVLKQVAMGKSETEPRQTTRLSRGRA
jgi:flagellar biogenesis protein FliO